MPDIQGAGPQLTMADWAQVGNDASRVTRVGANALDTHNSVSSFFSSLGSSYAQANRAAFVELFATIARDQPNASAAVLGLLGPAHDAGEPLTGRLVEKALNIATNNAAMLCDKWDAGMAQGITLSPRTQEGVDAFNETLVHVTGRMLAANPTTAQARLDVYNDVMDEIRNAPSVGSQVKERLLAFVGSQKQQFIFQVSAGGVPGLAGIQDPRNACWKMVMDGDKHASGRMHFDNECGYMQGMLGALNHMIQNVDHPLSADSYRELHDMAVGNVRERPGNDDRTQWGERMRTGYREGAVMFGLTDNMTVQGRQEFEARSVQIAGWCTIDDSGDYPKLVTEEHSPDQCRAKAGEIIGRYHTQVGLAAGDETQVLRAIARCCQDLDQHHLFSDGNIRSVAFLAMNKLLLQNGLSPTILMDPNAIDMHSIDEIVGLIRAGQVRFGAL